MTGFQANHNSQADVLLIAIMAAAAVIRALARRSFDRARRATLLAGGFVLAGCLSIGVVLSASRAGMALLGLALPMAVILIAPVLRLTWWRVAAVALGGMLLAAGSVALLYHNDNIGQAVNRFESVTDLRPEIWKDAAFAMHQYAPVGSGMGSFLPIFQAVERLNVVDDRYTNRAHNDYLELAIEAGIPGMLGLAAMVGVVGWCLFRAVRLGLFRGEQLWATATLLLLAVHSVIDYPLRSLSLTCIAAVGVAFILQYDRVPDMDFEARET
jgi:O-antigen ligase